MQGKDDSLRKLDTAAPDRTEGQTEQSTEATGSDERSDETVTGLTIVGHPNPERVGDRLALPTLTLGRQVALGRLQPAFRGPASGIAHPLEDRSISRRPVSLAAGPEPGSVSLDCADSSTVIRADGHRVPGRQTFSSSQIERGVALQFGRRVVLMLHRMLLHPPAAGPSFGLVGESVGLARVRREIARLASHDVPVLLRGATGTGKELVARALHDAGERRGGPFVAVNMAAVSPSLAAAELFGAVRGAYTGADRRKVGLFQHAAGGTLFLDEIGETPSEVQPMLLRALDSHEVLPVGGVDPIQVEVRVIAATDARLEKAISDGHFRSPLLHRLAGFTLRLPSLAERRDDVGRLLHAFLDRELARLDEPPPAAGKARRPWPPAEVVARLARHDWPGNVRELRNVARWLAIAGRDLAAGTLLDQIEELLSETQPEARPARAQPAQAQPARARRSRPAEAPPASGTSSPKRRRLRNPSKVTEDELLASLRRHRWQIKATSDDLGVSRANLYRLIADCPAIRQASELDRREIERTLASCGGDLARAAAELEVSLLGLKRRMTALGLEHAGSSSVTRL